MSLVAYKRRAEAVKMQDQVYQSLDLRSMKAFGSEWKNCTFRECQLDLTDWRASKFEGCHFEDCQMRLVNFSTCFLEECAFRSCDMEQASFMGSQFRDVSYEDCRLAYGDVMFQDATAKYGLEFHRCNLHGSSLDFREVEPKALRFNDCNLWGAKVSLGCAIFNGSFDERATKQFLALIARVSQDPDIARLAGDQYAVVCRAMDGRPACGKGPVPRDSMTSPVTTSTPILSFPDLAAGMKTGSEP